MTATSVVGSPNPDTRTLASEELTPQVSIVMPSFDVAPWITECLQSILHESRVRLEVIVVDDGSTDSSFELAREVALADPRVTVVRSTGSGGGQARNVGAAMARGEYLMFCDADDIVAPDGILRMYQAATLAGAEMVVGNFLKFSASTTWSPTERWDLFAERRDNVTIHGATELIRNRACWNRLFRRDFWEREAIRFPTVPRSNDIVPMTIAITRARRIALIPEVVYLYRQRPGNGSMTARAASTVGTVSYLVQEEICRALVQSLNDETLNAVYWGMLLESDAWVQAQRYVSHVAGGGDLSEEVETLIAAIVTDRRERSWDRLRPERQAVFSLLTTGHAAEASSLQRDLSSEARDLGAEYYDRQTWLLRELATSGHCTPGALSGLYTDLILRPMLRSNLKPDAWSAMASKLSGAINAGLLAVALRKPSAEILELHERLVAGDFSKLESVARERQVSGPVVSKVTISSRHAVVTLAGMPEGGTLVGALARSDASGLEATLSAGSSGNGSLPCVRVGVGDLPAEGPWRVYALLSVDGHTLERAVDMPSSDVDVKDSAFGRIGVRKPSTRQQLVLLRRASLARRVARKLTSVA